DETTDLLWALGDHQGSLRDYVEYDSATDSTSVAEHYNLDSFGNILSGDTSTSRYIYTGQEFDAETGMFYYDARYYAPDTGRFASQDPIGFNAGQRNPYVYVGNSPLMYTDPWGLAADIGEVEPERRTVGNERPEYDFYLKITLPDYDTSYAQENILVIT